MGYNLVRLWIRISLHLYFKKINITGLENVPKNKPVLFLPNHQNALLDVLLIGVDCYRKPWFLTRADVFKKKVLQIIFEFLQMIPVYRIRDGRKSLQNNEAVFERCASLLRKKEAVLIFPEANHNLKRRIRPLSKGFTRILFKALEKDAYCDIQLLPVGLNYKDAVHFPDEVTVCFGKPIAVQEVLVEGEERLSIDKIKKAVSTSLKTLTTHIEDEATHDILVQKLKSAGIDFLDPQKANALLHNSATLKPILKKEANKNGFNMAKALLMGINFPVILLWRWLLKPKVPEPEFLGTFRFGFSLVIFPVYCTMLLIALSFICTPVIALCSLSILFLANWLLVKMS